MKNSPSAGFRHLAPGLLLLAAAGMGCAQTTQLTPGTIVTGLCQQHTSAPGCVLPNLFGPQGITLAVSQTFPHFAHFIGSSQETLNQGVGTAIATQLTVQPIISPSSGFTYKYDSAAGVFVRSTTSFGPIYTERAETIGRGKISFGVSYQRFRFGSLDGIPLNNVPAVFHHISGTGPGGAVEPYEADVITTSNSLNLNMDQAMIYGTVGLTDRIDLSVAVPIVSVRFGASSEANIIRVSGDMFIPVGSTTAVGNPHMFTNGTLNNTYTGDVGSAAGIGDVTFRLKGTVYRGERFQVATLLDVRAPTGNAREFLGSGAPGIKPFVAISGTSRFSPHLNIGYQWNGDSILAGNLTGTTVTESIPSGSTGGALPFITNGTATSSRLPGQFIYSLGADYGVAKRLSLAVDYLGQVLFDTPRVFSGTFTTSALPGSVNPPAPQTFNTVFSGKDTIGLNS